MYYNQWIQVLFPYWNGKWGTYLSCTASMSAVHPYLSSATFISAPFLSNTSQTYTQMYHASSEGLFFSPCTLYGLTDLCMTFVGGIHKGRGTFFVLGTGKALLAMKDVTNSVHIACEGGGRESFLKHSSYIVYLVPTCAHTVLTCTCTCYIMCACACCKCVCACGYKFSIFC